MDYNIEFFIKRFEIIPEELWCIGKRQDDSGRRCAHGFCYDMDVDPDCIERVNEIEYAFGALALKLKDGRSTSFAFINNGGDFRYQQPTPKQRVLAALYDLKAEQEAEEAVKQVQKLIDNPVKTKEPCMSLV